MKNKSRYVVYFVCIELIIIIVLFSYKFVNYINYSEASAFDLQEVKKGTYVIYYSVSSNVPSDNYDVAIICYDNQIYEYKGTITIHNTDSKPHAKIINRPNRNNDDEVTIFAPIGSIEFAENVGLK